MDWLSQPSEEENESPALVRQSHPCSHSIESISQSSNSLIRLRRYCLPPVIEGWVGSPETLDVDHHLAIAQKPRPRPSTNLISQSIERAEGRS